jgi:predicted transcriptional regulator
MTQRALAAQTGVAQPTIARIEGGREDPRVATLERLLRACDDALEAVPVLGEGVDRTEIRELLALGHAARLATLVDEAASTERLAAAREVG